VSEGEDLESEVSHKFCTSYHCGSDGQLNDSGAPQQMAIKLCVCVCVFVLLVGLLHCSDTVFQGGAFAGV